MTVVTKLIVGVHTSYSSLDLFVSGSPGTNAPPVTVIESGAGSTPISYNSGKGGWDINLQSGDYILRIDMEECDWFDGEVNVEVVNEESVVFVMHTAETSAPNQHETIAWSAANAPVAGNDPKDPWPPPGMPLSMNPTSTTWFDTELHAARVALIPKSGDADADDAPPFRAAATAS